MMSLEILKLRFGESELNNLDVMIKDIMESKRMDVTLHNESAGSRPIYDKLHAKVLSRLFWPPFKDESLSLPAVIER